MSNSDLIGRIASDLVKADLHGRVMFIELFELFKTIYKWRCVMLFVFLSLLIFMLIESLCRVICR